jgi:phosphopantothenoylcysteine decarboxylase/phosphopantothenate--cysteine ligase
VGLRVLVTAGGTREPLDEVRFIGNRSSGRMGAALAAEASARGAKVTLILANGEVDPDESVDVVSVETAAELSEALESEFPSCDLLLMAAAVADFRPSGQAAGKIDKSMGVPRIELEPVPDLLSGLAGRRGDGQTIVGFAAEHGDGVQRARAKLEAKGLDAIVFNDISQPDIGFDSQENAVTLITRSGETAVPKAPKREIAARILDLCVTLRASSGTQAG